MAGLHLLWDHNRPDPFGGQLLLLARHELFQEVDGHVVGVGQVHADVTGEEVVDLLLAVVLGLEGLGRHLREPIPGILNGLISLVEVGEAGSVLVVLHCGFILFIIPFP